MNSFEELYKKIQNSSKEDQIKYLTDKEFLDLRKIDAYKFYNIFVYLIRNNQTEFENLIFTNSNLLQTFLDGDVINYYKISFSYDFLSSLILLLDENNTNYDNLYILVFNCIKDKENQRKFLNLNIKLSFKKKLLKVFKDEVIIPYIETENIYFTTKEAFNFLSVGIPLPSKYYQTKTFFLNEIMDSDITRMNGNISKIASYVDTSYLEKLEYDMFDTIITSYKDNKFNLKENSLAYFFLEKYKKDNKSIDINKKVLVNLIIQNLFGDNLRNVCLNLEELLTYNEKVNLISKEHLIFYKNIMEIFNSNLDLVKFYLEYKNKNVKEFFYDDLRKLKDVSYQEMLNSTFDIKSNQGLKNKELSEKYKQDVYELKGEPFVILLSCLYEVQRDINNYKRNCYTLINQDNLNVFFPDSLVFGYTNISSNHIMHVYEQDAYSNEEVGSSDFVSRIRDVDFLIANKYPNEIQIINDVVDKQKYKRVTPSYVICFDTIDPKSLEASKSLNIPIVLIDKSKYKKYDSDLTASQIRSDMYYTPQTIDYRDATFNLTEDTYQGKKL